MDEADLAVEEEVDLAADSVRRMPGTCSLISERRIGRGGGRGGFQRDAGPPDTVLGASPSLRPSLTFSSPPTEMGSFLHAVEDEMLCQSLMPDKVPYFNAPIYLANKSVIGKVDEILGPINEVHFSIKMEQGMVASSFKKGDKVYIGGDKLLPIERFLPRPKIPGECSASFLRRIKLTHHHLGVTSMRFSTPLLHPADICSRTRPWRPGRPRRSGSWRTKRTGIPARRPERRRSWGTTRRWIQRIRRTRGWSWWPKSRAGWIRRRRRLPWAGRLPGLIVSGAVVCFILCYMYIICPVSSIWTEGAYTGGV